MPSVSPADDRDEDEIEASTAIRALHKRLAAGERRPLTD